MTPTPSMTPTASVTPTPTPTPNLPGTLTGVVRNASTGAVISGASVMLVGGVGAVTTGPDGRFTIAGVPPGHQMLQTSAPSFVTDNRDVDVVAGTNPELSIALTPVKPLDAVTIVLTWGNRPADLDGHLSGPASGSGRFHLYWANRASPPVPYAQPGRR